MSYVAVWNERRWPTRGEHAPWCMHEGCHRRSRYVLHIGVNAVANYCGKHGAGHLVFARQYQMSLGNEVI